MFRRVQVDIQQNCQLQRDQPILIGVSGGADSLCLLDLLVRLEYPVVVAHYHHGLRPEADADVRFVETKAVQWEIPFVMGSGFAADYAQEHNLSIEEAARELRYRFLFKQACIRHAQAVVVAHNADDQVETVLMHLLRGSGLDGLTGMPSRALPNPWSETIPLVRPLLAVWRTEIETYCVERELNPVVDQTNTDIAYFRNRLRHELIPELETYVPGFRARLWQTADLLTADRRALDDLSDKAWQAVNAENGPGYTIFNRQSFNLQSLSLQRRLIRKAVSQLRPGARDLEFSMVQRVIEFAAHPTTSGQADLGLGLCIALEEDRLILSDWQAELPTAHWPLITAHYSLPIPGELDLDNDWILRAEIPEDLEAARQAACANDDPSRAWIDLGEQQASLTVRPRHSGDRFQPLGMDGKSMKISDFMINQKIPQRARAGWPLVCMGDEIVWLPDYRLAHPFRVTPETQTVILLSLQKIMT